MSYNPGEEYNLYEILQKADGGDTEAMSTAVMLLAAEGYLDDPDIHEKYVSYLERLAESGNADAWIMLGDVYSSGKHIPPDGEKAIGYYQKAADNGIAFGNECIGMLYYEGEVVQADYRLAFEYFTKTDGKKSFCTLYVLGNMYWNGLYVDVNREKACEYYSEIVYSDSEYAAMDMYYWRACYRLGHAHHIGEGVKEDLELARDMLDVAKDHAKEKADTSGKNDITYDEVAREWAEVCKELLSF